MNTTSVKKLNLQLICASEYLQQFHLNIHYKLSKTNIILDTLSRLASHDYQSELNKSSLDVLHTSTNTSIYANTLVEILANFCFCILHGYTVESWWKQVINMIKQNNELNSNAAALPYTQIQGLMYYKDIEKSYHLCILTYLYENVFTMAHDFMGHSDYVQTHKWLTDSLYLLDLSKHLHEYLQHCLQCQLMQTSQHCLYESMQPILTLSWSFHVLTVNFILVLPTLPPSDNYDIILSVTDKFSKIITLISGQKIMTVKDWVIRLMNCLALLNWGLPQAILSDKDHKFTAVLWKRLFHQLHVDLLFLVAYHPQTDSSSKTTNQVAEIVLHHWLTTLKQSAEWLKVLPCLQATLNNFTKYSSTVMLLNQILFDFWTHEVLNLLCTDKLNVIKAGFNIHSNVINNVVNTYSATSSSDLSCSDVTDQTKPSKHILKRVKLIALDKYQPAHIDTKNVIVFAAMHMKYYYNQVHILCFFSMGNMVNLHLHCSYTLSDLISQKRKLEQQFVGSLCITEQIKKLVYWLNLSSTWKIHNVISITHLEPAYTNNSYCWPCSEHSDAVIMLSDTEPEWELEHLLWKWTYCKEHSYITEYLTQWLRYGPEFDTWINIKDLENAKGLVNNFKQRDMKDKKAVLP